MEAQDLIKGLSGRLGIELDAGDACSFEADGMVVSMYFPQASDFLAMTCDIGEPPPERLEGLYKALLGANYMFGGTMGSTIALNPDDGRIMLCRAVPTTTLDVDQLCRQLEHFLNTAETWRKIVSDYREGNEETASGNAAGAVFSPGDFLRV